MRLIDADKMFKRIESWNTSDAMEKWLYNFTLNRIIEQPTVDAEPVIRCKDCKFLRLTGTVWKCQNRLVMMLCEPNDYCSRAERKGHESL